MTDAPFNYIYGPVFSWRLGKSLGIDPISTKEKYCSFDCLYCQCGKTDVLTDERKIFVPTAALVDEITSLPADIAIDYLTFSGNGEPTLAKNLGELMSEIRKIRKEKIAVITNSTLLYRTDVQDDLLGADIVMAKLDACSHGTLTAVNRVIDTIDFTRIVDGIAAFKARYRGVLALQVMCIDENKKYARDITAVVRVIHPDEVYLNTPLRPSPVTPLSPDDMEREVRVFFDGLPVTSVYDVKKKEVAPLSAPETMRRRGKK